MNHLVLRSKHAETLKAASGQYITYRPAVVPFHMISRSRYWPDRYERNIPISPLKDQTVRATLASSQAVYFRSW